MEKVYSKKVEVELTDEELMKVTGGWGFGGDHFGGGYGKSVYAISPNWSPNWSHNW